MGCETVSCEDCENSLLRLQIIDCNSCCFFSKALVFLSWSILRISISFCCFLMSSSISFICVSSTATMSFWKFVFASFVFALYDKIFSYSTWMYSSERLKLESNVDDDLFSSIISNSGSWDTSCCVHALFLVRVLFCIIIEIIIVHVTELYYDVSHSAEYIWILNRLLTDASWVLFLMLGSFFMVLASSENSAVDAFFLLFLPLQISTCLSVLHIV